MKSKILNRAQNTVIGLLAAGALSLLAGCAADVYPEPVGGVAYYDYDYYPDADVYFYPEGHYYYWRDHDHWRHGGRLPYDYHLNEEHREHLHLRTREPWTEHHEEHHGDFEHRDDHH